MRYLENLENSIFLNISKFGNSVFFSSFWTFLEVFLNFEKLSNLSEIFQSFSNFLNILGNSWDFSKFLKILNFLIFFLEVCWISEEFWKPLILFENTRRFFKFWSFLDIFEDFQHFWSFLDIFEDFQNFQLF